MADQKHQEEYGPDQKQELLDSIAEMGRELGNRKALLITASFIDSVMCSLECKSDEERHSIYTSLGELVLITGHTRLLSENWDPNKTPSTDDADIVMKMMKAGLL